MVYQTDVVVRWTIEEIFTSGDDRVTVRWTGSGRHTGDMHGIPPTGRTVREDAINVVRCSGGKIAESWEAWDTLGFLQQLGVVPK